MAFLQAIPQPADLQNFQITTVDDEWVKQAVDTMVTLFLIGGCIFVAIAIFTIWMQS